MGRGRSGLSGGGGGAKPVFSDRDTGDFRQMTDAEEFDYLIRQQITDEQQAAFDKYTNPNTEAGSLYNFSQNLNYAVATGQPLTPEQQKAWDEINGAMHNIGYNAELLRYDHGDTVNEILRQVGVSGRAETMTPSQLKKQLAGVSYSDSRVLSTSVNGFKNSSDPSVFTTRQFKFTYRTKAGAKGVMPGVGKTPMLGSGKSRGDDFGEMLLSPENKYKIVDVKYSGEKARRKGGSKRYLTERQIEIVVEVD